jgi:hypothetical protein
MSQATHTYVSSSKKYALREKEQKAAENRARMMSARALLRQSARERDQKAVDLAEQGYGTGDVQAKSGVDYDTARLLVLGVEPK